MAAFSRVLGRGETGGGRGYEPRAVSVDGLRGASHAAPVEQPVAIQLRIDKFFREALGQQAPEDAPLDDVIASE